MAYFEINNLHITHKSYEGEKDVLQIDHLEIQRGETYGLVGESGQGKTVLALAVQQLLACPPGKIVSGEVLLDGQDLLKLNQKQMQRSIRGSKMAMIFQDPMSCLNPVFTVGSIMTDVLHTRRQGLGRKEATREAVSLLQEVKLADAESILSKYPHQLSGGQRQRAVIASAMITRPKLLVCDEPTTALDVTVQKQILELLRALSDEYNVGILLISHDMTVVRRLCEDVAVMHKGRIVERGLTEEIFRNPQDEYTRQLIAAIPTRKRHGTT